MATNNESSATALSHEAGKCSKFRFDRNEWAGAFGDIGTDLPLIIGMILAAGLDAASVLILYGTMQVLTGFLYRLPMPVQPLKAVAIAVITLKGGQIITPEVLYGGGFAIGVTMLILTITGLMEWIGRTVPKVVVRGIQFGLGLQLVTLASTDYMKREGAPGYWLAGAGFLLAIVLYGNRKFPAALFIICLGAIYACVFKKVDWGAAQHSIGLNWPKFHVPAGNDMIKGFYILALIQVPLSIGNSILAARQTSQDLFPERAPSLQKISLTYSAMNLINPLFGGVPTCHGSGGLAGYYVFGARTGGAVIIYGSIYLVLGFLFSGGFQNIIQVFPLPILGVILFFEGISMLMLVRDSAGTRLDFFIVLAVGVMAALLPYGYLIALVTGTGMAYALPKIHAGLER